jgi:hypothetical protein
MPASPKQRSKAVQAAFADGICVAIGVRQIPPGAVAKVAMRRKFGLGLAKRG